MSKHLAIKVESLIFISDLLRDSGTYSAMLKQSANYLFSTFTGTIHDICSKQVDSRFVKYFMTVLQEVCSAKCVISEVSEIELHALFEILLRLLNSCDKPSPIEIPMKDLNACVIRILENSKQEVMLCVLLNLLCEYRAQVRMQNTINNCLMKTMEGIK